MSLKFLHLVLSDANSPSSAIFPQQSQQSAYHISLSKLPGHQHHLTPPANTVCIHQQASLPAVQSLPVLNTVCQVYSSASRHHQTDRRHNTASVRLLHNVQTNNRWATVYQSHDTDEYD